MAARAAAEKLALTLNLTRRHTVFHESAYCITRSLISAPKNSYQGLFKRAREVNDGIVREAPHQNLNRLPTRRFQRRRQP